MESDFEYKKELAEIKENEEKLDFLEEEASLLKQTLEGINASPIKNDELLIIYQAKLKANHEKQVLAEEGIKLANEKWIKALKKEESLLRQTLACLEASLIKNDNIIITYQARLKVNLQRQGLAQGAITLANMGCALHSMDKNIEQMKERKKTQESQPSNSQPIQSHPNFESTEMMPFLFHDRSSPIRSASAARTEVTEVKDDELNEMGYSS